MSTITTPRGRILSSQQVRFSDAPVKIGQPVHCSPAVTPEVDVMRDPDTGDIMTIIIRCGCGEETVVSCLYTEPSAVSADV